MERVGFEGLYKLGRWTPVTVQFATDGPAEVQLAVEAPDPYGSVAVFPSERVTFSAGTHRLTGYFQNGRLGGRIRVLLRFLSEQAEETVPVPMEEAQRVRPPLTQSAVLVATLGNPAGLGEPPAGEEGAGPLHVAALSDAAQLPADVTGYDSLDALIISGEYALSPERNEALKQWVQLGGHLVVSAGAQVSEYVESPLAEWVPVTVAPEPQRLRELSGLETFAGRNQRLTTGRDGVPAARIEEWQGRELVSGGPYGPLLVRVPYGFGAVSFLAVDLDRPPLAGWPATGLVVRKILALEAKQPGAEKQQRGGQLTRSGITDLGTQLRTTQEEFPQVERFSLWAVMGLLLGYLLLIGPLDYLLVHRVLKRPKLTWVTFPVMVVAAAALAVWGAQASNGDRVWLNQVDLIDIDVESGTCRARTWVNLYSPETRRYQAEIVPSEWMQVSPGAADAGATTPEQSRRMAWYGVPESTYGGMYRTGGFEIGRPQYEFAPEAAAVENLPMKIWSTRGLTADWQGPAGSQITATLKSTGAGQLSGSVSHRFDAPIRDWMLAYGNRVYLPMVRRSDEHAAPLAPGEELRPESRMAVRARELTGFLTGTTFRRAAGRLKDREEILIEQARYDPLNSRNPVEDQTAEIMRMITFHQAAGGTGYTGLRNSMLESLDLSELVLDLNRAVLFGRIDAPAARLVLNGETVEPSRRSTFVRIVLPVTREAPSEFVDPSELLKGRR